MKKLLSIILGLLIILILISSSFLSLTTVEILEEPVNNEELIEIFGEQTQAEISPTIDINDYPFVDNEELYQYDDPTSVVRMFVTVRKGNPSDNTNHTWTEVKDSTKFFFNTPETTVVDRAEIIFQIGDDNGPIPGELGFGEVVPNGTIQVRGNTSSMMAQKSYKIVLRENTGGWRGQYTIPINKHMSDVTRVRNKLSFDLVKEVPHLITYRTQFVQLFVKDETSNPPSRVFVDYGLYTHIEQPNTRFLRNHHLDPNAQLYKADFFEFYRYPNEIRTVDDPEYDLKVFETRLEVKGNENHAKLIKMLEDINNQAVPINETFEKYFDMDNYFSWMAFNILIGNVDTTSQNFYLYSPQNSEKWYFILWDYDGALSRQTNEVFNSNAIQYWRKGIQTYSGVILHKRVLLVEEYRQMLDEKINEIKAIITPELIESKLNAYREVTEPFLNRMPDQYYFEPEEYQFAYRVIPSEIENNYNLYLLSLKEPLPFFLGDPQLVSGELQFVWDESYDFKGEDITYVLQMSRDVEFIDIVAEETLINFTQFKTRNIFSTGTYFWRVIATNEAGYIQYAFDHYIDAERVRHDGVRLFYLSPAGKIISR